MLQDPLSFISKCLTELPAHSTYSINGTCAAHGILVLISIGVWPPLHFLTQTSVCLWCPKSWQSPTKPYKPAQEVSDPGTFILDTTLWTPPGLKTQMPFSMIFCLFVYSGLWIYFHSSVIANTEHLPCIRTCFKWPLGLSHYTLKTAPDSSTTY